MDELRKPSRGGRKHAFYIFPLFGFTFLTLTFYQEDWEYWETLQTHLLLRQIRPLNDLFILSDEI